MSNCPIIPRAVENSELLSRICIDSIKESYMKKSSLSPITQYFVLIFERASETFLK